MGSTFTPTDYLMMLLDLFGIKSAEVFDTSAYEDKRMLADTLQKEHLTIRTYEEQS